MQYLIDTQVFVWLMEKNPRLSDDLSAILKNPRTQVFISVASIWEIVLKQAKKVLKVPEDIMGGIKNAGFLVLPIEANHVLEVEKLPFYHKDPFDRLLISQAKVEKLTLVTADAKIWKYKVALLRV